MTRVMSVAVSEGVSTKSVATPATPSQSISGSELPKIANDTRLAANGFPGIGAQLVLTVLPVAAVKPAGSALNCAKK